MGTQLVWLKRDLRVHDHRALAAAAERGPVVCLYVYEPEVYLAEDFHPQHMVFINQSLRELSRSLKDIGGRLTVRKGRMPDVLDALMRECPFEAVWAHEETGNAITYDRDRRVRAWGKARGVPVRELWQNGVVRRLKNRDGWAKNWTKRMASDIPETPALRTPAGLRHGRVTSLKALGLPESDKTYVQTGGESEGHRLLDSFLAERGVNYRKAMSSPVTGWTECSRLSPYFAYGNLSVRQAHQATAARQQQLRDAKAAGEDVDGRWLQSLSSFQGRLRWHCHFTQKLEDEPRIEFENMNRAYDGLRGETEGQFDEEWFAAWTEGRTGYPFVDAVMRSLHATGWTNFRMRAMLVSFSSYHLWLHWRRPAVYLARQFLDYEPGIHYPQHQMQSGVTGINTVRIYSPAKQLRDQDPEGVFTRQYVPELARVPLKYLAEPHTMPADVQREAGCVIGEDYPAPVVDHREAYALARSRVSAFRRREDVRAEADAVLKKHGSRRRPPDRRKARAKAGA